MRAHALTLTLTHTRACGTHDAHVLRFVRTQVSKAAEKLLANWTQLVCTLAHACSLPCQSEQSVSQYTEDSDEDSDDNKPSNLKRTRRSDNDEHAEPIPAKAKVVKGYESVRLPTRPMFCMGNVLPSAYPKIKRLAMLPAWQEISVIIENLRRHGLEMRDREKVRSLIVWVPRKLATTDLRLPLQVTSEVLDRLPQHIGGDAVKAGKRAIEVRSLFFGPDG
jgi:hypothetical protein